MANEFLKGTQVPQEQRIQSRAPSGPDVNKQAHVDAADSRGGFAGAINELLGVVNTVVSTTNQVDKLEDERVERKHGYKADAEASHFPSYVSRELQAVATEQGKELDEMTSEEMQGALSNIKRDYVQSKDLGNKEFAGIMDKRLDKLGSAFVGKQDGINSTVRKKKALHSVHTQASGNMKSMSAEDFATSFSEMNALRKQSDELGSMTDEDFLTSFLSPLVSEAMKEKGKIVNGKAVSSELIKKLDTKEFKEIFSGVEGFEDTINAIKVKAHSDDTKARRVNYENFADITQQGVDAGIFPSVESIEQHFNEQEFPEGYEPNPRDMAKLKKNMLKDFKTGVDSAEYGEAVKSGDFTFLERNNITGKDKNNVVNKFVSNELGLTDMSATGVIEGINSGTIDENVREHASQGLPFGQAITDAFTMTPSGGPKAEKAQNTAFMNFSKLMYDTGSNISKVLDTQTVTKQTFYNDLYSKVDAGIMDDRDMEEAKLAYKNDLRKNTNSRGHYRTPRTLEANKSEDHVEWKNDFSTDAPWTTDANFSSDYIKDYVDTSFSLFFTENMTMSEAQDKAEADFDASHTRYENLDGSEGIAPREFMDLSPEMLNSVAVNHPSLAAQKTWMNTLGSDFLFQRNVAIHPANDYAVSKRMQVYYNGMSQGKPMTREEFDKMSNKLSKDERKDITTKHKERIKKLKNKKDVDVRELKFDDLTRSF